MNTADRWQQVEHIFHASLECAPQERADFLEQACANDPALRNEVEALLLAHESATHFLHAPAADQMQAVFNDTDTQIQVATIRQISHYQIKSLLGKGGMGEVYLATDTSLGRKAALKILPARYTTQPDLVHRFEREAKAASALNHPNILTVYEIGKTDDSHFIATEYIEGETLRQRLARRNLPLKDALEIAIQMVAALTAAHEAGIIHRDIKPENIMIRPDGYVKVLDFGLAKLTETALRPDESTTQTGLIMGTPSYMSPEQARGHKVDARTDIWSLGVVLFEMVSHTRPFSGASQADILVAILEREPIIAPGGLPPGIDQIIKLALCKDPNQRYSTAREMGQDLKALHHKLSLAGEVEQAIVRSEHATVRQYAEAPTLPMAPALQTVTVKEPVVAKTQSIPANPATHLTKRRAVKPWVPVLVGVILLGIGTWYWLKRAPLPVSSPPQAAAAQPKREFTYWLTAQRMLNGKLEGQPYQSAGGDWFPNGSKFKFNFVSPQSGHLYLLNQGLTKGGITSLNLLYPTPKNGNNNAAVVANQPIQSDNYEFDKNQGEERFWIIWSAQPVAEIEAVKAAAAANKSEIKDNQQRTSILTILTQQAPHTVSKTDDIKEQTVVSAQSEIAVNLLRLRHR